jgi:hypothetical protein
VNIAGSTAIPMKKSPAMSSIRTLLRIVDGADALSPVGHRARSRPYG